jgi:hypothetical protein
MGQTSDGLANGGLTAHYQISYDTSLSTADGLARAQGLFQACERDFSLMQSWFQGTNFQFPFPIAVRIDTGSNGASWDSSGVSINAGSGTSVDFVRFLLVMEVTEMFMASKDNGWFEDSGPNHTSDEGSKGEALSRFLGYEFMVANGLQDVRFPAFEVVKLWLNSSPRLNFIDANPDDVNPDATTGCGTCFLHFLHRQLGFSIQDIINAGSSTLGGVFANLTHEANGASLFMNLVEAHYPDGPTYHPAGDNIFPVPNLQGLSGTQVLAANSSSARILTLDTRAPAEVAVSVTSDDAAVLSVQGIVNVPVGSWAAAVTLTAAAVTGPAQTVTITATYAGKSLKAPIQILPRPSIIEGQVSDPVRGGIGGAGILIASDSAILPGGGNTLQLTADAKGLYSTPVVPPGEYQITALASQYLPGRATVTVGEGVPVTQQNFALVRAVPFTITGRVSDASGSPIVGATVTLDQNSPVPGEIRIVTDASGSYQLSLNPGSFDGTFTITASDAGFVSSSITRTIPNGATIIQNFTLAALGALNGFVGDASQTPVTPIAGALISVGPQQTVSDAAGRYSLMGLTPGPNEVKLTANGFDSATVSVSVLAGAATTQNFLLNEVSAAMTGTVTDAESGDPLRGASVRIGGNRTTTATDGTYTIAGIPAGEMQVTVSALRHLPQNTLVQFRDHQTVVMNFLLNPTGVVPAQRPAERADRPHRLHPRATPAPLDGRNHQ